MSRSFDFTKPKKLREQWYQSAEIPGSSSQQSRLHPDAIFFNKDESQYSPMSLSYT